jgi:hypothetical protein
MEKGLESIGDFVGRDIGLIFKDSDVRNDGTLMQMNSMFVRFKSYISHRDILVPWINIAMIELLPELPTRWVHAERKREVGR